MKTLVPQGVSRSILSRASCGNLPYSRQKCQKFDRNHPQGYPRNFHSKIYRIDDNQSPLSPPQSSTRNVGRIKSGANIATTWAALPAA